MMFHGLLMVITVINGFLNGLSMVIWSVFWNMIYIYFF